MSALNIAAEETVKISSVPAVPVDELVETESVGAPVPPASLLLVREELRAAGFRVGKLTIDLANDASRRAQIAWQAIGKSPFRVEIVDADFGDYPGTHRTIQKFLRSWFEEIR